MSTSVVVNLPFVRERLHQQERIEDKRREVDWLRTDLRRARAAAEQAEGALGLAQEELDEMEARLAEPSGGAAWEDADRCSDCGHFPGCDCPHRCTPGGAE